MPDAGGANLRPLMELKTIVVLKGDQTGQELLEEALRVIAPDVIGVEVELPRFDLSLESRRATQNAVVHEAARAIRAAGLDVAVRIGPIADWYSRKCAIVPSWKRSWSPSCSAIQTSGTKDSVDSG